MVLSGLRNYVHTQQPPRRPAPTCPTISTAAEIGPDTLWAELWRLLWPTAPTSPRSWPTTTETPARDTAMPYLGYNSCSLTATEACLGSERTGGAWRTRKARASR